MNRSKCLKALDYLYLDADLTDEKNVESYLLLRDLIDLHYNHDKRKYYEVIKNGETVFVGTARECAEYLNWTVKSIYAQASDKRRGILKETGHRITIKGVGEDEN